MSQPQRYMSLRFDMNAPLAEFDATMANVRATYFEHRVRAMEAAAPEVPDSRTQKIAKIEARLVALGGGAPSTDRMYSRGPGRQPVSRRHGETKNADSYVDRRGRTVNISAKMRRGWATQGAYLQGLQKLRQAGHKKKLERTKTLAAKNGVAAAVAFLRTLKLG